MNASHCPMPILVGAPRSGTTLLRFMLDSHPLLAIPPETGFLAHVATLPESNHIGPEEFLRIVTTYPPDAPAWEDFGIDSAEYRDRLQQLRPFSAGGGVRVFYRLYARRQGKPRYGDKTPTYCAQMPAIGSLLPEAHFIHIVRDGRDVVLSLRNMWFAPGKDMTSLAAYWSQLIRAARDGSSRTPHYLEVRYEELVLNAEPTLRRICEFVGLEFNPAMLRYWERTPVRLQQHRTRRRVDGSVVVTHERRLEQQQWTTRPLQTAHLGHWRTGMTPEDHLEFLRIAGGTLDELGYER
jgi:hypothetical protein